MLGISKIIFFFLLQKRYFEVPEKAKDENEMRKEKKSKRSEGLREETWFGSCAYLFALVWFVSVLIIWLVASLHSTFQVFNYVTFHLILYYSFGNFSRSCFKTNKYLLPQHPVFSSPFPSNRYQFPLLLFRSVITDSDFIYFILQEYYLSLNMRISVTSVGTTRVV